MGFKELFYLLWKLKDKKIVNQFPVTVIWIDIEYNIKFLFEMVKKGK